MTLPGSISDHGPEGEVEGLLRCAADDVATEGAPIGLAERAMARWQERQIRNRFRRRAALRIATGCLVLLAGLGLGITWRERDRSEKPGGPRLVRRSSDEPAVASPLTTPATKEPHGLSAADPPVNGGPVPPQSRLKPARPPESLRDPQPALAGFTNRQAPRLRGDEHGVVVVTDDFDGTKSNPLTIGTPEWSPPRDGWEKAEAQARREVPVRDEFVQIPFPRLAAASDRQIAVAVESYKREAAVVDARLTREVTLRQQATALADLCERLRSDTGIHLTAGASVADEKVTIFCKKLPLRDVMRQLSRPFGYTWLRSGKAGEYKYELVQDLRSQLLEEELRNRDRNEALLALDREMQRYRSYLSLSPDEALARAKAAAPEAKNLLEALAGPGWGALQIYSRLSSSDLVALRGGQTLTFSAEPLPNTGERSLPPDLARGVLQSAREGALLRHDKGYSHTSDLTDPRALPTTAVPEARAYLRVDMPQSEPGQFILRGYSGVFIAPATGVKVFMLPSLPLAVGISPALLKPQNGKANARLASDPTLRSRVAIEPLPWCGANSSPSPSLGAPPSWRRAGGAGRPADTPALPGKGEQLPLSASGRGSGGGVNKLTTADVLEALHRATGFPIVADHYTRLHRPRDVSVQNQSLFDALNQLADAMRLRWSKEGEWLQFRSAGYFYDRLKEVPDRLLSRWAASRRQHGALTLDDLVEIAQLPDTQLEGAEMAEGARLCFGLSEWDLARSWRLRPHLRFLAELTPAQRQETMSATGLPFARMSLAQQQRFISLAFEGRSLQPLEDFAGATLRVDYSLPGWFQWGSPDEENYTRWVVPLEPGPRGRRVPRPPVRERTPEAALQAVRRLDPGLREALLQAMCRADPRVAAAPPSDEAQIFPSRLGLKIIYVPGATNAREIVVIWSEGNARHGG